MLDFLKNTVYIRLSIEYLSVLQVESNILFSDQPWVAIKEYKGKRQIISYGKLALTIKDNPDIKIINGFKHPRTIIADFNIAELAMTYSVKQVFKHRKYCPSPIIIIHPMDEWEGGLTPVEIRALRELCCMAGARAVYCWQGLELSKNELETLEFPSHKGKLLDQ
ncbi:hypothetical protein BAC3_01462 [uncultured bacterium]|nr:hypothetical protein BAC3_01462 [uncultured bacterium]